MLLTCRAAMAGLSGGLAALKVAPAGESSCAGAVAGIDAGQFCRLSEDRNRSLGGDRPDVGRRTGLMIQSFRSGPMCQVKSAVQGALDTRARIGVAAMCAAESSRAAMANVRHLLWRQATLVAAGPAWGLTWRSGADAGARVD